MSVALSLSSFFASQRLSVGAPNRQELCRSLANSLAKSIENRRENRSKIDPRRRLGALKIAPGTLSGHPVASKSVPKASRERLGSVLGRPWRGPGAPKKPLRVPREARKGALERLGARQGGQNRYQVASGSEKIEFFLAQRIRKAPSERFFIDFCRFSGFLQSLRTLESIAPASKNKGSALRAAS